jgi:hypothetical protein
MENMEDIENGFTLGELDFVARYLIVVSKFIFFLF